MMNRCGGRILGATANRRWGLGGGIEIAKLGEKAPGACCAGTLGRRRPRPRPRLGAACGGGEGDNLPRVAVRSSSISSRRASLLMASPARLAVARASLRAGEQSHVSVTWTNKGDGGCAVGLQRGM